MSFCPARRHDLVRLGVGDADRATLVLRGIERKRLTYRRVNAA